jgi:N-carbamoyl-L-amino-acid hydrolase
MEMAKIGAIPGNGVNRQALTREDIAARKLLIAWAEGRGFSIGMDAIGNLFIRRQGRNPDAAPVLTGSHMDSQPSGGRFDGIYGVLAGLEALEALDQAGAITERPIEVVAWTNEEGGRFSPGAMGSMVFTESRRLEDCLGIADSQGILFGDALAEALAATPKAEKRALNFPVAAYVEAHIEQGPKLESEGLPIGVVTGIQGSRWFEVEVLGESAHAGTTPLKLRRDALQEALAAITALTGEFHHRFPPSRGLGSDRLRRRNRNDLPARRHPLRDRGTGGVSPPALRIRFRGSRHHRGGRGRARPARHENAVGRVP